MTREQAERCRKLMATVEDRNNEDFKTGVIDEIVNATYCIVAWDDDEGSMTICAMRNLVVQYPEQVEVA